MSDFVYDNTALPDGKVDNQPLSVPSNKGITAAEWNTLNQAVKDLRTAVLRGQYHGLTENAAAVSAAGVGLARFHSSRFQLSENAGDYRTALHPDVNVLDFGADPTGSADSAPAIRNAINSFSGANSSKGGTIIFPPGTYRIASTIHIKKCVRFKGHVSADGVTAVFRPDAGIEAFRIEAYNTPRGTTDSGSGGGSTFEGFGVFPAGKSPCWQSGHDYTLGQIVKVGPTPQDGSVPLTDNDPFGPYPHYVCTRAGHSGSQGPRSIGFGPGLDRLLNYSGRSAAFHVGQYVTGGISGAQGIVIREDNSGSTGTLRLTGVSRVAFQNGEPLTDPMGGAATASGVDTAVSDDELDGDPTLGAKWQYIGRGCFLKSRSFFVAKDLNIASLSGCGIVLENGDPEDIGAITNSNGWQMFNVSISTCDGHGLYVRHSDTNGGSWFGGNVGGNGGAGAEAFSGPGYNIFDGSFLGNTYVGITFYTGGGQGIIYSSSIGGGSTWIGCYVEGGGLMIAGGNDVIIGGGLADSDIRTQPHSTTPNADPPPVASIPKIGGYNGVVRAALYAPGFNALDWRASTFRPVGFQTNNGGNLYQCITAGITASSGGPTGTGSDITDGTCHWKYLSAQRTNTTGLVVLGDSGSGSIQSVLGFQPAQDVGAALSAALLYNEGYNGLVTQGAQWSYGVSGPGGTEETNGKGWGHATNQTVWTEWPYHIPAGKAFVDQVWIGGCRHRFGISLPTEGTFNVGDRLFWKGSAVVVGGAEGKICTVAGTIGTYDHSRTATTHGNTTVDLTGAAMSTLRDQQSFRVGDRLLINGVDSRVQAVSTNGLQLTMGLSIGASSGLAINYVAPTFVDFGLVGGVATGSTNGLMSAADKTKLDGVSGSNSGDVTLTAVGSAPSANGASLSGQTLTLQPADATHPGLLSILAQTIAGLKTFSSQILSSVASGVIAFAADAGNWGLRFVTNKMEFVINGTTRASWDGSTGFLSFLGHLAPLAGGLQLGTNGNPWDQVLTNGLYDSAQATRVLFGANARTLYMAWLAGAAGTGAHMFANANTLTAGNIAEFYIDNQSTLKAKIDYTGKAMFVGGLGVGNSASATTPGSVVKKIEVFDASGTSLGFLPVYSSIS